MTQKICGFYSWSFVILYISSWSIDVMQLFNNVYECISIHVCYHIYLIKLNCTVTSGCISSTGEGIDKFGPRWRDGVSKATVSNIHCRINVPAYKVPWMSALQITSGETISCTVCNYCQILLSGKKYPIFQWEIFSSNFRPHG